MFAPLELKAKAGAGSRRTPVLQRSTRPMQQAGDNAAMLGQVSSASTSGRTWDFSKVAIFPPETRQGGYAPHVVRSGVSDASKLVSKEEDDSPARNTRAVHDQSAGSGSGSGVRSGPSTTGPTVDRIDLVNTTAGAITSYAPISSGDLNTPGPFNSANGVNHALQVHFHLDKGDSSTLTPRREIQRTATAGGRTSMNPPDRLATGGIGPPAPGGFGGVLMGPDGPGAHEIRRPSKDKIVVADAPGLFPIAANAFPVTYKAHFTVTIASGTADIARIKYDVVIDKRTSTEVPNTENRSLATAKEDLVRARPLP